MSYYDSLVDKDEQEAIALRGIPPSDVRSIDDLV